MRNVFAAALTCASLASCAEKPLPAVPDDAGAAASSAPVKGSGAASSAVAAVGAPNGATTDAGGAVAAGGDAAGAPSSSATLTADMGDASDTAPLPNVKVANIGMHIGGGPNDVATKDPIAKSVEPHFDDFRRCFARVYDPKRGGDFGVDLLIPPDGGQAKVSHPRTSLKGERFDECVMGIFENVEFQKPRFGLTTVSYSLRFTPGT